MGPCAPCTSPRRPVRGSSRLEERSSPSTSSLSELPLEQTLSCFKDLASSVLPRDSSAPLVCPTLTRSLSPGPRDASSSALVDVASPEDTRNRLEILLCARICVFIFVSEIKIICANLHKDL